MESILQDMKILLKNVIDSNLKHVNENQFYIKIYIDTDYELFNKYLKENNEILQKNLKFLYLYSDLHKFINQIKKYENNIIFLN